MRQKLIAVLGFVGAWALLLTVFGWNEPLPLPIALLIGQF